jgi:hypothetical protein
MLDFLETELLFKVFQILLQLLMIKDLIMFHMVNTIISYTPDINQVLNNQEVEKLSLLILKMLSIGLLMILLVIV